MFEFPDLCDQVEALSPDQRAALMAEKSATVVEGLRALNLPINPFEVLMIFVVGSVMSDGSIREKDYLKIRPTLEKVIGDLCDLAGIERTIKASRDERKEIEKDTTELLALLGKVDEELSMDIVILCLLVTSVDGKVSSREKRYIKQLCRG